MFFIGIDLGTSAVKLLLMKDKGEVIKITSREYKLSMPREGYCEQNPCDWWEGVCDGIKELVEDIDSSEVEGLSFGGQMHGLVVLDEFDEVIRPAILWNDTRTEKEVDYLNNKIGKDRLIELTGNIAFAGFTAPKILWLKENEPENFAKIDKIMLPKDYIAYKMTGVFSTDFSDASGTLLLNVENKKWSEEMLEICGLDIKKLPFLYESYENIGNIRSEVAYELNLSDKCIVAAGAGDNAAAAIGTGTVFDGLCNISVGTSGTLFVASDNYAKISNAALHSFAHSNGEYHLMGCMLSAASCNKWWCENILNTKDYSDEQKRINKLKNNDYLGENSVYFLPYLCGERSPHNDASVRGAFVGLSMNTSREDMTQAVLEGVAYAFRDMMEVAKEAGITIQKSRICGGGAKSKLWRYIIAHVLGIEVEMVEVDEGPALGAAILAAVACEKYKTVEEAVSKIVKTKESIVPDKILQEKYNKGYSRFKKMYPLIKEL